MAAFLQSIEQLRKVNWSAKHLWDIRFEDNPKHTSQLLPPFTDWFPAAEVSIEEGNLDTHSFDLAFRNFEIPAYTSSRAINITFYDSEDYLLFKWLRDWMNNDILNLDKTSQFVSRLGDVVKTVHITKMNAQRSVIDARAYFVFPKQSLNWEGISQPQAQQDTMTFVIAGTVSESN